LGGGKYINFPEDFLQNDSGVKIRLKWGILAKKWKCLKWAKNELWNVWVISVFGLK
jgi:hypothetical protein